MHISKNMYTRADLNDLYDLLTRTTDDKLVSEMKEAILHIELDMQLQMPVFQMQLNDMRRKSLENTKEFDNLWKFVYSIYH